MQAINTTDWQKLQNGSDIRGVALEGVTDEAVNLTSEVVKFLVMLSCIGLPSKITNSLQI